jgi:hypothetical protein
MLKYQALFSVVILFSIAAGKKLLDTEVQKIFSSLTITRKHLILQQTFFWGAKIFPPPKPPQIQRLPVRCPLTSFGYLLPCIFLSCFLPGRPKAQTTPSCRASCLCCYPLPLTPLCLPLSIPVASSQSRILPQLSSTSTASATATIKDIPCHPTILVAPSILNPHGIPGFSRLHSSLYSPKHLV